MTARMRRLASDYEQVKKDFAGHKNIIVTPIGDEAPEKYHITYFVNGIYLLSDGKIEVLSRHEVEIMLHADYPRYKPICTILTPIWHPNFRDGQICIGDIWGAGESLSDIIINIGDMIQYKSWNSYSPLSADAAQWAIENKHLFPVGNINLNLTDYASAKDTVDIDLFDESGETIEEEKAESVETPITYETGANYKYNSDTQENPDGNDFEITAEELEGIEFVPTADRMQTMAHGGLAKGKKVNFKTILMKGLLWALIGAFLGFGVSELADTGTSNAKVLRFLGHDNLAAYAEYSNKTRECNQIIYEEYELYCERNHLDPEDESNLEKWVSEGKVSERASSAMDKYFEYDEKAEEKFYLAYTEDYNENIDEIDDIMANATRISTAIWTALFAVFLGIFLGMGEGIFYGSGQKAVIYALIGAGVSLAIGFLSGYLAQWMYAELLTDESGDFIQAFIRGIAWAIMGLGMGLAVGLIKPAGKRILFCLLGGLGGGFIGGFLFNFICDIIPNDIVARGLGLVITGLLIGLCVGLLEQFAKQAWLKVVRGEFEGKEYLVFTGTTSIGNTGKNTIVLFKDKLIGPHHCDIVMEGNKYVLVDCGTPMGTVVNGNRITRHVLRRGDSIAIGNSMLVFNTK